MKNTKQQTGFKYYWAIDLAILLAVGIGALLLRILPNQETVFGAGWINLQGNDAWYHVRLIENLLQHFPQRITFDPYTYFPNGQEVFFAPFFDILIGFFAWVIGLGNPSQHTIEMVAAYTPPVMGALAVIPVYFIGKILFNRYVGLIAALILVFLPTMFLATSLLAQADHHVAEVLFSSISVLFLLLALKYSRTNGFSFSSFITQKKQLIKPVIFAVLCGIMLGVYLMTWVGGLLFVLLFFGFFVLMFIIDYFRNRNTDYLTVISVPTFLVPLLMIIPFHNTLAYFSLEVIALLVGTASVPLLVGISRIIELLHLKRIYFLVFSIAFAGIIILATYLIDPGFIRQVMHRFETFTPNTNALTIAEVQPVFMLNGKFSFERYWGYFRIPGILAIIGLIILVIKTVRDATGERVLFLSWFLLTFMATVGQSRFTEYLTIVYVILSGLFIWYTIDFIPKAWDWVKLKLKQATTVSRKKKQRIKQPEQTRSIAFKAIHCILALGIIFLLGIFTSMKPALDLADDNQGTNRFWHEALTWMKTNTPEPFGDADFYYSLYNTPVDDEYDYPDSAYGVLSWWPYGHIITQVAHRIPNANPHQAGASGVAHYLLNQDDERATRSINRLGARYLMIDITMALPDNPYMTRFPNIATWAGNDVYDYADVYYRKNGDKWEGIILYYPEYYRSMMVRLYNFNGAEVRPTSSTVISYNTVSGKKLIQSMEVFPTYREAMDYIDSQTTGNFRIVGTNPLASPVPLAKMEHYQRVYQTGTVTYGNKQISYLKIFEYSP